MPCSEVGRLTLLVAPLRVVVFACTQAGDTLGCKIGKIGGEMLTEERVEVGSIIAWVRNIYRWRLRCRLSICCHVQCRLACGEKDAGVICSGC